MGSIAVAIAVLSDLEGNLLFQRRAKQPYRGYLGLVGGKVEKNEALENAVRRELKEETSLEAQSLEFVGTVQEFLIGEESSITVALHVFKITAAGIIKDSVAEGAIVRVIANDFYSNRQAYIPADWFIVDAVINNRKILSEIKIEKKGEEYEIKSIKRN